MDLQQASTNPNDYFNFFQFKNSKLEPDTQKIVRTLEYSREDIAQASSLPIKAVRHDEKIPEELKEKIRQEYPSYSANISRYRIDYSIIGPFERSLNVIPADNFEFLKTIGNFTIYRYKTS